MLSTVPLAILQDPFLSGMQRVMAVGVSIVLIVVLAAAGIVVGIVRRGMRQRVEAERLKAMGVATARILHQVKNPLQSILLHAEMLEDPTYVSDDAMRRETSGAIVASATRMEQLLGELSAYASGVRRRLERGRMPLHRLVAETARGEAKLAASRGIELRVERLEPADVRGDPYYLRQALGNVLRNALDAFERMPDRARTPAVVVSLRVDADRVAIEVADNGPGVPTAELDRVFEPFVTTKADGMGLGLAICREIVEGHDGEVRLRSRPAKGTTVTLELPLLRPREPLQTA